MIRSNVFGLCLCAAFCHSAALGKCPVDPTEARTFAETEFNNIVSLVMTTSPNLREISSAVDEADNDFKAYVHSEPSGPVIRASRRFVDSLSATERGTTPYWAKVFWVAHEVGHVQLNHDLLQRPCDPGGKTSFDACQGYQSWNHDREYQADKFAAHALVMLGALPNEVSAAFDHYAQNFIESRRRHVHPSISERSAALESFASKAGTSLPDFQTANPIDVRFARSAYTMHYQADIDGYELYSFPSMSASRCAGACTKSAQPKQRRRCEAFSYDRWAKHCYLKSFGRRGPRAVADWSLMPSIRSDVGVRRDLMSARPLPPPSGATLKTCTGFATLRNKRYFSSADLGAYSEKGTKRQAFRSCRKRCHDAADKGCVGLQIEPTNDTWTCSLYSRLSGWFCAPSENTSVGYVDFKLDRECAHDGNVNWQLYPANVF